MSTDDRVPVRARVSARRRLSLSLAVLGGCAAVVFGYLAIRPHANPDRVWRDGEEAIKVGRIDEARDAVDRLSRLREPTTLDRLLRAQVNLAQGRIDEALVELDHVPAEHPMAAQARLMVGQVELRRHRARDAERWLREAARLDPALAPAHRELIYILGYQLRRAELNAEFEALSRISELTFDNAFHWSLMRSVQWEPGTAVDELVRFIQADPEDRWSRLALAENYRRMGRLDEAADAIAPLSDLDAEALVLRVMLALDLNQPERAEELLKSGPADSLELARLRGRLALARRDFKSAVKWFRLAEKDSPDNRDVVFGLINALTSLGQDSAAAPLRETARKLDRLNSLIQRAVVAEERENAALLRDLGAANADLGRIAEARAWYKLAIARNPVDTEAQQALFRLGEGRRARPARTGGDPPAAQIDPKESLHRGDDR